MIGQAAANTAVAFASETHRVRRAIVRCGKHHHALQLAMASGGYARALSRVGSHAM
jgi:hypothetical protein